MALRGANIPPLPGGTRRAEMGIRDSSSDLSRPSGNSEPVGRRGMGAGPGRREPGDRDDRILEASQAEQLVDLRDLIAPSAVTTRLSLGTTPPSALPIS